MNDEPSNAELTNDDPARSAWRRAQELVARHPIIVGILVGCTLLGIALGILILPAEWTLARRIAGGAVGGAGCGLIFTAPRIIG